MRGLGEECCGNNNEEANGACLGRWRVVRGAVLPNIYVLERLGFDM